MAFLLQTALAVQPSLLVGVAGIALFAAGIWWARERRARSKREMVGSIYALGEEILACSSPGEILAKLESPPKIFGSTRVRIYIYDRGAKALHEIEAGSGGLSIPLHAPAGCVQAGAAACFEHRTLLAIPDTLRSPFPAGEPGAAPRSLLFLPMLVQSDIGGVLELDGEVVRRFSPDEQAIAQHLSNQIGIAIKLIEQRSIREQIFRSEKLAGVGRLISEVVNELQAPLASISRMAEPAINTSRPKALPVDLRAIASEAHQASEIVKKLISFAKAEQVEARPVDVNRILRNLFPFRDREWKEQGIQARNLILEEPLYVLGSEGQLEQVFLDLLMEAQQSVTQSAQKVLIIRTSFLAKRALIEITYTGSGGIDPASGPDDYSGMRSLAVCRSIIAGHGGELRLAGSSGLDSRFEVELPLISMDAQRADALAAAPLQAVIPAHAHRVTAILMEPDEAVQRQLVYLMSERGHRAVPVRSAEQGIDLVQRMHFEIAFCSIQLPGLNWVELFGRIRHQVDAFILLSDGYNAELVNSFQGESRFVLSKPIQEAPFSQILQDIETRAVGQPAATAQRTAVES